MKYPISFIVELNSRGTLKTEETPTEIPHIHIIPTGEIQSPVVELFIHSHLAIQNPKERQELTLSLIGYCKSTWRGDKGGD